MLETSKYGVDTGIDHNLLPPIDVSAGGFIDNVDVGEQLADSLATMVKKKFVAGPFPFCPISYARINQMFPLIQPDKCRMIVNMSYPLGESFNDKIPPDHLRKVTMASAQHVGELIRRCNGRAVLSKYDHVAAYKMIPCKISDLRLQGLRFLGHYFFETKQIFGASPAVNNYDDLHMLMLIITIKRMKSIVNPLFLPRILDDLIGIFTSKATLQDFHNTYTKLAKEIDVKLAPTIGTKAYVQVDEGIALGILFNCKNSSWALPDHKQTKYISKITSLLSQTYVTLNELEEINGIINYIVTMSTFLRFLRHHLLHAEKSARSDKNKRVILSIHARLQLMTWLRIIKDASNFPLQIRDTFPPINVLCILADASGKPENLVSSNLKSAAAAVSYVDGFPNTIIAACQAFFDEDFVTNQIDEKGTRYGDKTTLLELLSILLGIIHNKDLIYKHQILILSDNLPALWALQKGRSSSCLLTSTVTLAIATLLQSYESYFYLKHEPRLKTYPALVADSLTRNDACGQSYAKIMKNKLSTGWPHELELWLRKPYLDDSLGTRILDEISK